MNIEMSYATIDGSLPIDNKQFGLLRTGDFPQKLNVKKRRKEIHKQSTNLTGQNVVYGLLYIYVVFFFCVRSY